MNLFRAYELEISNNFSILAEHASTANCSSPDAVFRPDLTSSPHDNDNHNSNSGNWKKQKGNNWRSITVNFNSIRDKAESLHTLVEYTQPDVIFGCETKITDKVHNTEILPPGYQTNVFRKDRTDRGGGVLLAFKDGYVVSQVEGSGSESEAIWAQVAMTGQAPTYFCSMYRPPGSGPGAFTELDKTISKINPKSDRHLIVSGDLNCGHIDWSTNTITPSPTEGAAHEELLKVLNEQLLTNTQHNNTRGDRNLDLYLTTRPSLVKAQVVIPGISDHEIVLTDSDITPRYNPPKPRKVYSFRKADWKQIKSETVAFTTGYLASCKSRSVDTNWEEIKGHLHKMMSKYIPSRMKSTRQNLPWLTVELKRMCRRKQRLYNKARESKDKSQWKAYQKLKKKLKQEIRSAHRNYINGILTEALEEKNHKPFWSYIKAKKKDVSGIAPLRAKGTLHCTSAEKSEILSEQFSSVFTRDSGDDSPTPPGAAYPEIDELIVRKEGVLKLLLNINIHKASGPDQIPNILLKELANEIAPALTELYNQTLKDGDIPVDWRRANVAPIFKKGDRHNAANYRPVSLTCVCSKLMEHIVVKHIVTHLDKHGILTNLQHGFRSKHSCVSQLLLTVSDFAFHYDNNTQVDVAILDYSKAFDVVSHRKLGYKLDHYGIRGSTQKWVTSFLKNRTQQVVVEGESSTLADVLSGVPQGTCLGPILFLIYINDITHNIDSQLRLFADDALLYRPIRSFQDHVAFQRDLDSLQAWATKWDMKFNTSKCYVIQAKRRSPKSQYRYSLNNQVLKTVETNSYLGVLLSEDLTFTAHIDNITAKASRSLGFLSRNLKACPQKFRELAYISMVRSTLEYASPIWDPHLKQESEKLERVQRRAARFVTQDFRRSTDVDDLIHSLEWDTLKDRRSVNRLTIFYQIVNNEIAIPKDGNPFLKPGIRGKYKQLEHKCAGFRESFYPRTIRQWNSLPTTVKESPSLEVFKSRLRTTCC